MPYRVAARPVRRLPVLSRFTIETPCRVPWDEMRGDGVSRFCFTCSKTVYDLTRMHPEEAETFLERHLENDGTVPCARVFRRPDGRVLTDECAHGARARHVRRTAAALAAAMVVSTAAALAVIYHVPMMNADDADPIPPDVMMKLSSHGGMEIEAAIGEIDLKPMVTVDEVALAEEADPESELLGTSARTMRRVAERQAARDRVIPGKAQLVSQSRLLGFPK